MFQTFDEMCPLCDEMSTYMFVEDDVKFFRCVHGCGYFQVVGMAALQLILASNDDRTSLIERIRGVPAGQVLRISADPQVSTITVDAPALAPFYSRVQASTGPA